jgi:subtilisin family serine protease
MTKLDAELWHRSDEMQARALCAEAGAPGPAGDEPVRVIVSFTGDLADLTAVGFRPLTFTEHPGVRDKLAPGTVPLGRLQDLASIEHVVTVNSPSRCQPLLNYSLPEIRAQALHNADPALKGKGVVIGVIDSGIEWRHRDFVTADGTSRIIGIWDQLLKAKAGEQAGPGGLGVVYIRKQIQKAVEGTFNLRSFDTGIRGGEDDASKGHGTNVAAIAAGDGSSASCCPFAGEDTYVGVAPLAELIIVHSDLGEDHVCAGIDFIVDHPELKGQPPDGKPKRVVINLSFAKTVGSHDGSEPMDKKVDAVVKEKGCVIVAGAGNFGDMKETPCHITASVPAKGSKEVGFTTGRPPSTRSSGMPRPADDVKGLAIVDLWYRGAASLTATVTSPDGKHIGPSVAGKSVAGTANPDADLDRQSKVKIKSTVNDPLKQDSNINVTVFKPANGSVPSGPWKLTLVNAAATEVPFHVWSSPPDKVGFPQPSPDSTIGSPASAAEAITVANHEARKDCWDCCPSTGIHPSSSRGPVARGAATNPKPDIAAPGQAITAALADAANLPGKCCDCCLCPLYTEWSGTSQSAPHVTGTIALMLEVNPQLTKAQILTHLKNSARKVPGGDPNLWGAGKLDAQAAIEEVRKAGGGGGGGGGGAR